MHTLTVKIQDSVFQEFLNFVSKRKESIEITQDNNLALDPYFYERQKELTKIRADIKNGASTLSTFDEFEKKADALEQELELKYAN